MKRMSDQSIVQADVVFPQGMCMCEPLECYTHGDFDTETTFSMTGPPSYKLPQQIKNSSWSFFSVESFMINSVHCFLQDNQELNSTINVSNQMTSNILPTKYKNLKYFNLDHMQHQSSMKIKWIMITLEEKTVCFIFFNLGENMHSL